MDVIRSKVPGIYIHSIQIGSDTKEDIVNGFFKNANDQITMACQMLTEDPKLSGGFNAMGFSQVCVQWWVGGCVQGWEGVFILHHCIITHSENCID